MTKNNIRRLLEHWILYESFIDRDGNISPSAKAIHITDFYFIKHNSFTKNIESMRIDQQGGILIDMKMKQENYRCRLHVLFDGVIDYYLIENNSVTKERLMQIDDSQGFGTDKYKF